MQSIKTCAKRHSFTFANGNFFGLNGVIVALFSFVQTIRGFLQILISSLLFNRRQDHSLGNVMRSQQGIQLGDNWALNGFTILGFVQAAFDQNNESVFMASFIIFQLYK